MRQCLRMIDFFDTVHLFDLTWSGKDDKDKMFYSIKLADEVVGIVERVLPHSNDETQVARWRALKQGAMEMLRRPRNVTDIPDADSPNSLDDFFLASRQLSKSAGKYAN